ncbi:MAG: quinone-dependent dihydroorotate dehydrogenase [Acidobacteria bacterium]|nr:MAG: quinone-dependent dihydroorotate dehydrogenase [Acidobacteriota bacterium]REK02178.1 MAG: quinone-dependent dihydroorotate dehydrogenase [Acidobacteriota bacterium]REK14020.1 MAG: quinone-dependent dihydroorotate dehydrogenase [Acidobacteriota bacterium]REK42015.1 MAG: quinone-dependent dihydroorotate dehydrogenase [Acidobacteriota bacterium]
MSFYEAIVKPLVFKVPAETAHEIGIGILRASLSIPSIRSAVKGRMTRSGPGGIERFGLRFPNPVGIAAGFDKNGLVVTQLASLGFGFIEVGTVTLRPQAGNPKPRLFRLPKDRALINRLGFNNQGASIVAERLSKTECDSVVGVNIGKNKDVDNSDAVANYLECFRIVQPVADYVTVNVSSPNTPNLRELQGSEMLERLLSALQNVNSASKSSRPILLKIAPDLSEKAIEDVVSTALRNEIAGIIATNTTVERSGLVSDPETVRSIGAGGLSGLPLKARSTKIVGSIYKIAGEALPIIGVGGIFSGEDAFEKIAAGASLVQAYSGFVFQGPGFARNVNEGLAASLDGHGFKTLDEAVGSGV